MAVPGIIQFTKVMPRKSSLPRSPWFSTMAQIKPMENEKAVVQATKTNVFTKTCRMLGSRKMRSKLRRPTYCRPGLRRLWFVKPMANEFKRG